MLLDKHLLNLGGMIIVGSNSDRGLLLHLGVEAEGGAALHALNEDGERLGGLGHRV
jgi:hypothetical protein